MQVNSTQIILMLEAITAYKNQNLWEYQTK